MRYHSQYFPKSLQRRIVRIHVGVWCVDFLLTIHGNYWHWKTPSCVKIASSMKSTWTGKTSINALCCKYQLQKATRRDLVYLYVIEYFLQTFFFFRQADDTLQPLNLWLMFRPHGTRWLLQSLVVYSSLSTLLSVLALNEPFSQHWLYNHSHILGFGTRLLGNRSWCYLNAVLSLPLAAPYIRNMSAFSLLVKSAITAKTARPVLKEDVYYTKSEIVY